MLKLIIHRFRIGTCALLALFLFQLNGVAMARDTAQVYPIADAMATPIAKSLSNVDFFFGNQQPPSIKKRIGIYRSKRTTNAALKSDAIACQWAFLSAIKTFAARALAEGGNAVINIRSVTTSKTGDANDSAQEYTCRAGAIVAKVYLEGEVVLLNE